MSKEVRRAQWAQFLRKFSANNHYRRINISFNDSDGYKETTLNNKPFIGLALEKKGRLISGIRFFAGRGDADNIAEPVLAVNNPDRIIIETDDTGEDKHLIIRTKDLRQVNVNIGPRDDQQIRHLVENVAYSLYLKRGGTHGADFDDWQTAEKKVKETEEMFV